MISKAIIAALAIAVAMPAVAQQYRAWPPPSWNEYREHPRWNEEQRERERIEREREREHHRIQCSHNPYLPHCYQ